MKKVIAATGVTLTLALGTSVLPANNDAGNEAHAATQPYYNYTGYTAYDTSFVLDSNFVRALQHGNVTLNGYKIQGEHQATNNDNDNNESVKVYDQKMIINPKTNRAITAAFPAKSGQISKQDVINAYGSNYNFVKHYPNDPDNTGIMKYEFDGSTVNFNFTNGYLTSVGINGGVLTSL
ncbi:immunodominant staphylococcal antigen IsaB family protein [Staphylococcus debuckii]|uniref:immunodominant staphylococcal antigen IsaB family protein n=1 Tax=Staphylococcus debuckii TaxID=2044912 RepID=UPI000F4371A6|nr:hypothetical protein [Staphylococcus debuckii]AYU54146.1 hypothetical protein CNQ82_01305 [Staphylococcus debuckii]